MIAKFSARSARAIIAAVTTAVCLGSGATLMASAAPVAAVASAHPGGTTFMVSGGTGNNGTPWT
jgi:hypothetical protein